MYIKSTNSQNKNLSLTVYNNITLVSETRYLPKPTPDPSSNINIEYFNISKFINETSVMIAGVDDFMMIFNYICCNNEDSSLKPCSNCDNLVPNSILIKANSVKFNEIKTSYLTDNVSWSGSYVVVLQEDTLEIHSWFNLLNNSGIDYNNARLKIVAGDINLPYKPLVMQKASNNIASFTLENNPTYEPGIIDYYIYILPDRYTLYNNTIKRIKNFYKSGIKYDRIYSFGYDSTNANITIKFLNTTENNLGFPLPSGNINTYTNYNEELEFIGGSSINNIANNMEVSFAIGKYFGVTSQRSIITFQKHQNYMIKQVQYIITNTRNESVSAEICEPIFAPWQIDSSSDKYTIDKNNNPCFLIKVDANSKKEILFAYKYYIQSN